MSKLAARILFIMFPAIVLGAAFCIIHWAIGAVVFAVMIGVGIDLTRARPERGESP